MTDIFGFIVKKCIALFILNISVKITEQKTVAVVVVINKIVVVVINKIVVVVVVVVTHFNLFCSID